MLGKREIVHLLDLVLQVHESAEEQGLSEIAAVAAVQADTLEYVLGVQDTEAENFVLAADATDEDETDYVQDEVDVDAMLYEIFGGR